MIKQFLKKADPKHLCYWLINAFVFNICRLITFRNRNIWCFGESEGKSYVDNTKYLFEYVNKYDKTIKSVWLTTNKSLIDIIRNKGFLVYNTYSIMGIWYSLRAGIAIYNKSLGDFGPIPLVGGAKLVTTWHGAGFKRIYRAADTMHGKLVDIRRALEKIFNWTRMDLLMATSEYHKKQFLERFDIEENQIIVTGQPRNDVFNSFIDRNTIMDNLNINHDYRLVLYMPTYRPKTQGTGIEENIVKGLINNKELERTLIERKMILLIKLHPVSPCLSVNVKEPYVLFSQNEAKVGTQELLGVADILITDYSSCFVDYSLLKRPVLFYVPDEDDYLPHMEGMDKEYYEICSLCQARTIKELIDFINSPRDVVSHVTNALFEDQSIDNKCYSANVYNAIKNRFLLNDN